MSTKYKFSLHGSFRSVYLSDQNKCLKCPHSSGVHWILCLAHTTSACIPMSPDCSTSVSFWDMRDSRQGMASSTPRWYVQYQAVKIMPYSISWVVSEADLIWKWLRGSKNRPPKVTFAVIFQSTVALEGTPHALLWIHWLFSSWRRVRRQGADRAQTQERNLKSTSGIRLQPNLWQL